MSASRLASLLLLGLALPACAADGSMQQPAPDARADFAKATPAQRQRAIAAATGQDIYLTQWLVFQLATQPASCVRVSIDQDHIDIGANGCATGGITIAGAANVIAQTGVADSTSWTSMSVDLQLTEPGDESLRVSGDVTWVKDARGVPVVATADLETIRGGIDVLTHKADGDAGYSIDVLGVGTATVTGDPYDATITGQDSLHWITASGGGDCGSATFDGTTETPCLWKPAVDVDLAGPVIKNVAVICDRSTDSGMIQVEVTEPGEVTMSAFLYDYRFPNPPSVLSNGDSLYQTTDDPCDAYDPGYLTVELNAGTVYESSIFLGVPSVEYVH